ncbi:hypothetical protein D9M73_214570 [compost metagenome]
MSQRMSSSGSNGGWFQNTVFGSRVSWYQDRCVGFSAMAWRRSPRASSSDWSGRPCIRSRLKLSNPALRAMSAARIASSPL